MPSKEYLEIALEKAKEILPDWAWKVIHQAAMPVAGGKARWREPEEPSFLEKMALTEMRPDKLKDAPDEEVLNAWRRLHQWYSAAKKRKDPTEEIINASVWVMEEFDRRGFQYDEDSELAQETKKLRDVKKAQSIEAKLAQLPEEVVVVPNFVCVVGSAAIDKEEPEDIDVLFRADRDESGDNFLVQAQNVWLPVRKVLDPEKKGLLHYIDGPTGPHGDHLPIFDLVLRRKQKFKREIIKGEALKLDLGCGNAKPEGYVGLDKEPSPQVDVVHDLEQGIPYPDNSADEIRANHVLEHLSDKERIMAEIHRVLKPGGKFVFEVPSTKGEGAFNHPGHVSYWNKSSFAFWTQDDLLEGRPKFEVEKLEEVKGGDLVYVRGVLRKPETVTKARLAPFEKFTPPKPQVALYTELYTVDELWEKWGKGKVPFDVEAKENGFRSIVQKDGSRVELWFEGQLGKDQLHKFPEIKAVLEKIDDDFILDCDLGMFRNGKRVPRPDLMKFNREKPEFAENEVPTLTVFDIPYWNEDLHEKPFKERREKLEQFFNKYLKGKKNFAITQIKWCNNLKELKVAARWAFNQDHSEGLVAKTASGKYELDGATDEWSKVKRIIELKVIVLDKQKTKAGAYNYWGGLLPSVGMNWENTAELNGKTYINLGKTFSTSIDANKGNVLTVEVLELIPDEEKKELAWLGARVVDVDKTRKTPYTAAQAIDIAKRGQVLQKSTQDIVPSRGPKNAKLAFVGASPGRVEAARGEPFTGPSGETFKELYLKPLGPIEAG